MKISVIIPLYNKENYIGESVNSVLNQSYKDFELIIVNDGSTDNSLSVVKEFDDSRIRIINKPNGGESTARNAGIENAKFEFVSFLDADDLWYENYLETMIGLNKKFPEAGMYCAGYDLKYNTSIKRKPIKGYPDGFQGLVTDYFISSSQHSIAHSNTVMIKKDVFEKVGMFNTELNHGPDLDMWFKIALNYDVALINVPVALHKKDVIGRVSNRKREANVGFFNSLEKNFKLFKGNKNATHYINKRYNKKITSLLYSLQFTGFLKLVIQKIKFNLSK